MGNITITGLSPKQRIFADIIWQFEDSDMVTQFIDSLPTAQDRIEAHAVVEMMILSVMDEYSQVDEAEEYLKKFRLSR
jgi:hypothetical protein